MQATMTQNTAAEIGFQKVEVLFLPHSKDGKKAKTSILKTSSRFWFWFIVGFWPGFMSKFFV